MQETGPLGANMFLNTRLQLRLYRSESTAVLEAQTIRVLDGVTSGGAQVDGGVNQKDIELASDSELRARHPHDAHRHRARGPPLSHRQRLELSRHLSPSPTVSHS